MEVCVGKVINALTGSSAFGIRETLHTLWDLPKDLKLLF